MCDLFVNQYINGLMHEKRCSTSTCNSIGNALELRLSGINP